MLVHPEFDPVAVSLGPLAVRWYGLMYLVGFALFLVLGKYRARQTWRHVSAQTVDDLLFYGVLAIVLGGRLGFCLFYQPGWYLSHPLDVFKVWQGGMSAHGGILGAVLMLCWYARSRALPFWELADFAAPLVPLGLLAGRIGNFINGELWGRAADPSLPWAMIFPQSGTALPRHPSQLYEAGLEGALLFVLVWGYSRRPRAAGTVGAVFCIGYALARFCVEFFREPDSYLGLGLLGLSRGQWLTLPVLVLGLTVLVISRRTATRTAQQR